jgi:hypothetical protein
MESQRYLRQKLMLQVGPRQPAPADQYHTGVVVLDCSQTITNAQACVADLVVLLAELLMLRSDAMQQVPAM